MNGKTKRINSLLLEIGEDRGDFSKHQ